MEGSKVEVLIPKDTEVDIKHVLTSGDGLDQADFASLIEQRSLLYFDESLPIYIALRIPYKDEAQLKSYITRLAVSLEIIAYGFQPNPSDAQYGSREGSPGRNEDSLWSGEIDISEEPITIVQKAKKEGLGRHVLAIWRAKIPLSRPKMRLQSPMLVFKPSAILRTRHEQNGDKLKDPMLPSGVPASINLLESLKGDPTLQGGIPRLSASRLSSVMPQSHDEAPSDRIVEISSQKSIRALPAISSRVRYSRSSSHKGKPSVIACLEIETAPISLEDVEITEIDLQLSDGFAEKLGSLYAPGLPLICRAKDNQVFLYCLTPNEALYDSSSSTRTMLITVHAFVLISETCRATIVMRWKTGVDFSTALNPTFGTPGQSMQRARRPSSLSRASTVTRGNNLTASARETDPAVRPVTNYIPERAASVGDFGVSVTFIAPKTVQVGHAFSWEVLVLNRSSKPRHLVLTVVPKFKKGFTGGHLPKASASSSGARRDSNIVEPVTDENTLYSMQMNAGHEAADVISLSTDVSIGPLAPESCLSTQLKLLPLAQGHLRIEAVRVVDLETNASIDIRDLPGIVAVGQNNGR